MCLMVMLLDLKLLSLNSCNEIAKINRRVGVAHFKQIFSTNLRALHSTYQDILFMLKYLTNVPLIQEYLKYNPCIYESILSNIQKTHNRTANYRREQMINRVFFNVLVRNGSFIQTQKTFNCQNFMTVQGPFIKAGIFTEKLKKMTEQKPMEQVKKQIEHLANKPSFTLMDYKQRILDQLHKIKTSIRAKMSSDTQQQQKELQVEKKVLSCLYQEELNEQYGITHPQKKAISLITQVEYNTVTTIFKKAERYKKMHSLLRQIKQNGDPLPQTMQELSYLYMKSGLEYKGAKDKYMKYEKRSRIERGRFTKWRKAE